MRNKSNFDLQASKQKVAMLKKMKLSESDQSIPMKGLIRANIYAEERLQHQMSGGVEAYTRLDEYKAFLDISREVYESYQLLYDNYLEAKGLKQPKVAPCNVNRDYASNNYGNGYDYSNDTNSSSYNASNADISHVNHASTDDFINNIVQRVLSALGGKLATPENDDPTTPKPRRGRPPKKKKQESVSTKETRDITDKHDKVTVDGVDVQISGKMSSDGERMLEDDIEKLKLVPDPTILGMEHHPTCTNLPHNIIVFPEYYVPKEDKGPRSHVSFSRRAAKCQMGNKLHMYADSLNEEEHGGLKAFADMITSWYDIALDAKYRRGLHYSMEGVVDNLSHICMAFGYACEHGCRQDFLDLMWNRLADIKSGKCANNFFYPFEVKQFDPQYIAKDIAFDRITTSGVIMLYHIKQNDLLPDFQLFQHRLNQIIDVYTNMFLNDSNLSKLTVMKRSEIKGSSVRLKNYGIFVQNLRGTVSNLQSICSNTNNSFMLSNFDKTSTLMSGGKSNLDVMKSLLSMHTSSRFDTNTLGKVGEYFADLKSNTYMNELPTNEAFN